MAQQEKRLEDLEVRIAHQEAAIEELTRTAVTQESVVRALRQELETLRRQMLSPSTHAVGEDSGNEPPPHY